MRLVLNISLIFTILITAPARAELLFSEDSREAVEQQTPILKEQLREAGFEWGAPIFVRIFKQSNQLELWLKKGERFELFRSYPICERSGYLGPKISQGDEQAPEGFYSVIADWMHPFSDFHLAFNIRYPNDHDRMLGRTGSAIMVHGGCSSSGCFAMTDEGIEEIYTLAEVALLNGQERFKVHVFPFPLTDENLARHRKNKWHDFWLNLKEGSDLFEANGVPPNEYVVDGRYMFEETSVQCAVAECQDEDCVRQSQLSEQAVNSLWRELMKEEAAAEEAASLAAAQENAPPGEPDGALSITVD